MVDEANGLDKIEELQNHSNREIYEKAVNILETFFDVEDGENENLAPAVDANQVQTAEKPCYQQDAGLPQAFPRVSHCSLTLYAVVNVAGLLQACKHGQQ